MAHPQSLFSRSVLIVCIVAMLGLTGGCSSESSGGAAGQKKKGKTTIHLVELASVAREVLEFTAAREGSLRAVREVKLFNQEEGRITAVLVHEGDDVVDDQTLLRLDDRLLHAEMDKAVASLRQAELDVERLQQLMAKKLVSEDALTRAQTAREIARAQERALRTRLSYMTIRAPFAGTIAQRLIEPGDVAPKHTHLLTLIDPSVLVTDVQVSELVLPHLKVGDRASVRIDALGSQAFPGSVLRIYPTVDPSTRRGQMEVALTPVPSGARPGQFCRVTLFAGGQEHLVIPYAALRQDAKGEYVFLFRVDKAKPDRGEVRRVAVVSGLHLQDKVEIRKGLQVGQQVVAKGFIGLADGKSVKPVIKARVEKKPSAGPAKAAGANDA